MHQRSGICGLDWMGSRHVLMSSQWSPAKNFACFQTFDKLCDGFSNEWNTLGVGVCADGTNFSEQFLSTLDRVCGENILREVYQLRVFGQRCDLERRSA